VNGRELESPFQFHSSAVTINIGFISGALCFKKLFKGAIKYFSIFISLDDDDKSMIVRDPFLFSSYNFNEIERREGQIFIRDNVNLIILREVARRTTQRIFLVPRARDELILSSD
jgi:flagellar assembly factor FliW